jgi:hypothetical protein
MASATASGAPKKSPTYHGKTSGAADLFSAFEAPLLVAPNQMSAC